MLGQRGLLCFSIAFTHYFSMSFVPKHDIKLKSKGLGNLYIDF